MSVVDVTAKLEEKRRAPPTREPDIQLDVWLHREEVDWVGVRGGFKEDDPHPHWDRTCLLLKALHVYARESHLAKDRPRETPALVVMVGEHGGRQVLWCEDSFGNTNRHHAAWWLRRWWDVTRLLFRFAYHAARGTVPRGVI